LIYYKLLKIKNNQLRKGYTPIEAGPKENINKIYKSFYKPRVDRKDLDFFFELFDMTKKKRESRKLLLTY